METIKEICQQMRDAADRAERYGGIYDMRELSTETFRVIADRIEKAVINLLQNILTKPRTWEECCERARRNKDGWDDLY